MEYSATLCVSKNRKLSLSRWIAFFPFRNGCKINIKNAISLLDWAKLVLESYMESELNCLYQIEISFKLALLLFNLFSSICIPRVSSRRWFAQDSEEKKKQILCQQNSQINMSWWNWFHKDFIFVLGITIWVKLVQSYLGKIKSMTL